MLDVGAEQFEDLVSQALDTIPAELLRLISNCVIVVADRPPPDEPDLLGRYEGIPLTQRGDWYSGVLPDRITIYRLPTLEICRTPDEVKSEVRITVVHEIAHHFGITESRLHDLGWG